VYTYLVDLTNRRAIYDVAKEVLKEVGTLVRARTTCACPRVGQRGC
jgi:hypothetical protein